MCDTKEPLRVAVGVPDWGWHEKFVVALDAKIAAAYPLRYDLVDLNRDGWWERVRPYDMVIWNPGQMGLSGSAIFKEKIHLMERYLGKIVVPSYETVWHFESKNAQSYLFALHGVPTPRTSVCFDPHDALERIESEHLPLVFKRSHGAASQGVELIRSRREAKRLILRRFCWRIYRESRHRSEPRWRTIFRNLGHGWMWRFLWEYLAGIESLDYVYWQEFVPQNAADVKVVVIGNRYAYAVWRENRPHDFRASGSGRLIYDRPVPENLIRYCLELNQRLQFDSMGYDLIFRNGQFLVLEMSYGYDDRSFFQAPEHFELTADGELQRVAGHVWPETFWIEWALERALRVRGVDCRTH